MQGLNGFNDVTLATDDHKFVFCARRINKSDPENAQKWSNPENAHPYVKFFTTAKKRI